MLDKRTVRSRVWETMSDAERAAGFPAAHRAAALADAVLEYTRPRHRPSIVDAGIAVVSMICAVAGHLRFEVNWEDPGAEGEWVRWADSDYCIPQPTPGTLEEACAMLDEVEAIAATIVVHPSGKWLLGRLLRLIPRWRARLCNVGGTARV